MFHIDKEYACFKNEEKNECYLSEHLKRGQSKAFVLSSIKVSCGEISSKPLLASHMSDSWGKACCQVRSCRRFVAPLDRGFLRGGIGPDGCVRVTLTMTTTIPPEYEKATNAAADEQQRDQNARGDGTAGSGRVDGSGSGDGANRRATLLEVPVVSRTRRCGGRSARQGSRARALA